MQIDIRPAERIDAPELSALLNEIIELGGTTALENPFSAHSFLITMIVDPAIVSCFVAIDRSTKKFLGFQLLERYAHLPDNMGNIATFTCVGFTQRGIGSCLFKATRHEAIKSNLVAINATIRADNYGGLAFYRSLGFVDCSVRSAVPLRDGTLVDRIGKRYILGPKGDAPEVSQEWA